LEKQRFVSLDIFRGLTMLLMTIVNNPGDWGAIFAPLEHAEWHGCTPTDLVFPFFVFAMGAAMPFSGLPQKNISGDLFQKILVRSLRIFCLGLALNFFSKINIGSLEGLPLIITRLIVMVLFGIALLGNFSQKSKLILVLAIAFMLFLAAFSGLENFKNVRIPGVLQRIGIVYFIVAIIYHKVSEVKWQYAIGGFLLLLYWFLMTKIDVPGYGPANLNKATNLAAWLDFKLLPNNLWVSAKTWDPEGFLSTIPAIVTALFGIWTGFELKKQANNLTIKLVLSGIILTLLGYLWGMVFPINKALWTSSYVVYTAGIAILILGVLNFIFDKLKPNPISRFLLMWGVNPMIVFYASGIIPRILGMIKFEAVGKTSEEKISLVTYIYNNFIVAFIDNPKIASITGALIYVVIWSIILVIFNKRKLIFKV
jgi:predicted acyltransferase